MTDYTPTTEEVRDKYASWSDAYPEFDRWLAEVKAQAWEAGYVSGSFDEHEGSPYTNNPYLRGEEQ